MKYLISVLLWISNLTTHIENHKKGILGIYPKKIPTCIQMLYCSIIYNSENENTRIYNNGESIL